MSNPFCKRQTDRRPDWMDVLLTLIQIGHTPSEKRKKLFSLQFVRMNGWMNDLNNMCSFVRSVVISNRQLKQPNEITRTRIWIRIEIYYIYRHTNTLAQTHTLCVFKMGRIQNFELFCNGNGCIGCCIRTQP